MKKLTWAAGLLLLVAAPVLAWAGLAHAQRFAATVDKDEVVNSTLYSTGKNVDIKGTINGDVYCGGQTVNVDATVHGDVLCAGQDVTISGKIDGSVRVAGQTVSVSADISRSATLLGATVSLDANAKVAQDITLTGDQLNIKGDVTRDVIVAGNNVIFNGNIGRDVKGSMQKAHLRGNTVIAGDLDYSSPVKATIDNGAVVKGKTTYNVAQHKKKSFWHINVVFYLFVLFGLLLLALLLLYLFPDFLRKQVKHIETNFAKTLLVGLLASFVLPVIAIGLIFSVVGIPLTFFMFVAWMLGAMLAGPIVAYYVGERILRKRSNPFGAVALGSLVIVTAYFLPLVGTLMLMLAYWLGFGALLLSLKTRARPLAR